ncbi:HetP family heterocyst commitment protein [Raphidiopsis sp. BLCC-F218]
MNHHFSNNTGLADTKINPEQFDQVIEAILAGKYSWACVLMLRFVGYNPLHYIPYRTYNRLIKENSHQNRSETQKNENLKLASSSSDKRTDNNHVTHTNCLTKIKDLAYLEVRGKKSQSEVHNARREKKLA